MTNDLTREEWKRVKDALPTTLSIEALDRLNALLRWNRANREFFGAYGSATEMRNRAAAIFRHASELTRLLAEESDSGHGLFHREAGARCNVITDLDPELRSFLGALQEIAVNAEECCSESYLEQWRTMSRIGDSRRVSKRATQAAFDFWNDHVGRVTVTRGSPFSRFAAAFHEVCGCGDLNEETLIARVREMRLEADV